MLERWARNELERCFQCVEDRQYVRADKADGDDDHDGDQPGNQSILDRGGATIIAKTFEKTRHLDPFLSDPDHPGSINAGGVGTSLSAYLVFASV